MSDFLSAIGSFADQVSQGVNQIGEDTLNLRNPELASRIRAEEAARIQQQNQFDREFGLQNRRVRIEEQRIANEQAARQQREQALGNLLAGFSGIPTRGTDFNPSSQAAPQGDPQLEALPFFEEQVSVGDTILPEPVPGITPGTPSPQGGSALGSLGSVQPQQQGLNPAVAAQFLLSGGNPQVLGALQNVFNPQQRNRRIIEQGGIQYFADTGEPVIQNPAIPAGESELTQNLTPGQEAVDKKFAEEFVEFNAKGGFADSRKNLDQLKNVISELESGVARTGNFVSFLPDPARAALDPEGLATQQRTEEVVQRNLREILGPQFTQKEGDRLIARAFDPRLPAPENIRRIKNLVNAAEASFNQRVEAANYFEEFGTLNGFDGDLFTAQDIEGLVLGGSAPQPAAPQEAPAATDLSQMSDAELLAIIQGAAQ